MQKLILAAQEERAWQRQIAVSVAQTRREQELKKLFEQRKGQLSVQLTARRDYDSFTGAVVELLGRVFPKTRLLIKAELAQSVVLVFWSKDGSRQEVMFLPKGTPLERGRSLEHPRSIVVVRPDGSRLTVTKCNGDFTVAARTGCPTGRTAMRRGLRTNPVVD